MPKTQARIRFTYEDYKSLPESETKRYELLEGELVMVPAPSFEHQAISWKLERVLGRFMEDHRLGTVTHAPLDVVLGEDIVQPDIIFISRERAKVIHKEEIRGAPDLIAEILSPTTAQRDRTYKRTLYARHGVTEYWLVDPDSQMIEVLLLGKSGYRRAGLYRKDQVLESPLLPDLKIPLAEIF